ncbi:ABC transporter permease [Proteinivorax tanatarense]|uniref:ABC transporter permease n=1 Tax=Proteinivorax tanatarense TaxID=1260629 RepID=A0AAU7VPB2_9FIRM
MNKKKLNLQQYLWILLAILVLNFMIPRLMPGDPFTVLSTEEGGVHIEYSEKEIQELKAYYGLDQPIHRQFYNYLAGLIKGDLGYSIYYKTPVSTLIMDRILWTLLLVIPAILISGVLGMMLGVFSGFYRESPLDKVMYTVFVVISEIPGFLMALALLFIFGATLNWFPLSGGKSQFLEYSSWFEHGLDILKHSILPLTALVFTRIGDFYLLTRNTTVSILDKAYIKTARGKGLTQKRILFVHCLKNVWLPVLTRMLLSFGALMGGAILVENVFAYPGVGRLMRQGVQVRDYPLIQGAFLTMTMMVLFMNMLADMLYGFLDPRVRKNEQ